MRKLATADRMLGEGKDVADACQELQVSEQTHYRWRNQFGWEDSPAGYPQTEPYTWWRRHDEYEEG